MQTEPAPQTDSSQRNEPATLVVEPTLFELSSVVVEQEGPAGPLVVTDGSRIASVQPGLEIVFKSASDAAVCALTREAPETGALLTLDATRCEREVRLLCDCAPIAHRLMAVPADAVLALAISLDLQVQDKGEGVQWVSLLSAPVGGPYAEVVKVAKRVPLSPGQRTTAKWRVELTGGWRADERLYLAVQMAPHAKPVSFGRMSVAIESVLPGRGGLTVAKEGVEGWVPAGDEASACLLIGQDGGALARLPLAPWVSTASVASDEAASFALTRDALATLVQAAGAVLPCRYDVALVVGPSLRAQVRLDLAAPAGAGHEGKAPEMTRASHPQGAEPVGPLSLARADVATLVRELVVASSSGLVRDTLQALYKGKEREKLWQLWDELKPGCGRSDLDAYLAFYFARAMLQQNMAGLAYEALEGLARRPGLIKGLMPPEQRQAHLLLARAAVRSGRRERARHELDRLKCEDPADWEVHFDLGLLHEASEPDLSRRHFRLADALEPHMPVGAWAVRLETLLDAGQTEEALVSGTLALKHHGAEPELLVSLANIYRALGDRHAWAASLNRVFALSGVTTGFFDAECTDSGHVLEGLSYAKGQASTGPASSLVTVVMTAYNAEATIGAAIRSVLAQSYPHLRLVVVDDASTDKTRAIVSAFAQEDRRVVLLDNDANRGTYWAKNRALSQFASDYYTFHDSDDWMHPERIAAHVAHMQQNPKCVASLSQWLRISESGHVMLRRRFGAGSASYTGTNPASLFITREVINRIGYFDAIRAAADSEYTYRIGRVFGRTAVQELAPLLGVGLHHEVSLTQSGAAAFDANRYSKVRQHYWESWMAWHRTASLEDLYVAAQQDGARKFAAPGELLSSPPVQQV
ncbi:glycosyltransferase family 2 protein [Microvirga sp. BT689]|uniref:glycosyltransferase family A protein n=1 Tax=Microvirga arvi TaxID=2778731 RepID=UPI00194EC9A0|nr:glycosyltransferase family A protein [Microvirga arvi]MBM6583909.1 glycosyltransferase family 2 protein [Microvirga arvi]